MIEPDTTAATAPIGSGAPYFVPDPATAVAPSTGPGTLRALLAGVRPLQWSKNLLVFMAPAAAGVLGHERAALRVLSAFAVFCVVASAVYLFNDVMDAEADRLHPDKCRRPVASGDLPAATALGAAAVLLAAGTAAAWFVAGWVLVAIVGAYVVVSVAYSLRLKREPVIELAAVASGFVLRGVAGGAAAHVPLSSWFLVVISFGALFVAAGKRTGELHRLSGDPARQRTVLAQYTPSFLRSTLVLTASVTVAAYCLWAFGRGGLLSKAGHHVIWIQLTVVPITIGVLHVLRLLDAGQGDAPEKLALRDHVLQFLGLTWLVLLSVGLYG